MKQRLRKYLLPLVLSLIIAGVAAVSYFPTLKSGFLWDDTLLLINPLRLGQNPYYFFFGGGIYFRPVVHLVMAFDYSFWHLSPMGYHITNILLHVINASLVFLTCFYFLRNRKMPADETDGDTKVFQKRLFISFLAAMLFAVHPIHTEPVAWISGRTDILATIFFLLAFLAFLVYEEEKNNVSLILSGLFFLFSLFAKENAASFIGVVFLYGLVTKTPRKNFLLSQLYLFSILATYFIFRGSGVIKAVATSNAKESFFVSGLSLQNCFKILVNGTGYYFEKLVFPFHLNLLPQIPDNTLYLLVVLLPFIFSIFLYITGRKPEVVLIGWVIITLMPSLSILYSQMAAPIGERYLYLPSVGFCILLSVLLFRIKNRQLLLVSASIILLIYSFSTFERLQVWKDEVTLWEDTARKNNNSDPNTVTAHTNYGAALARSGKYEEAREPLFFALKQKKISFPQAANILNLLGMIELNTKNYTKAEEYLASSLKANPKNSETYNNLGFLYSILMNEPATDVKRKNELYENAMKNFHKALSISPSFLQPKYNLGICYMQRGDFDNAEKYLNAVVESDPQGMFAQKAALFLVFIDLTKKKISQGQIPIQSETKFKEGV